MLFYSLDRLIELPLQPNSLAHAFSQDTVACRLTRQRPDGGRYTLDTHLSSCAHLTAYHLYRNQSGVEG